MSLAQVTISFVGSAFPHVLPLNPNILKSDNQTISVKAQEWLLLCEIIRVLLFNKEQDKKLVQQNSSVSITTKVASLQPK